MAARKLQGTPSIASLLYLPATDRARHPRSGNRPNIEEGRRRCRAIRRHLRQDAELDQPDTEGEAGDGSQDAD